MLPRGAGHPHALIAVSVDTKIEEGARKAPSFALWAAIVAIIALAGGAGLVLPHLIQSADPISPAIAREYAQCHADSCRTGSLIPEIFKLGEPRAATEQRLATAGYEDRNGFYAKPAHSDVPGCDLSYYVVTRYDKSGALMLAFGEVASTCK